jgi:hypothetical protein
MSVFHRRPPLPALNANEERGRQEDYALAAGLHMPIEQKPETEGKKNLG